ncbi:MAG: hypothetical protein CSA86_01720 [Arcobacter sp.]|nr:MAG: hypothetical protein CSA86_01720 [Arcobacter sp.]
MRSFILVIFIASFTYLNALDINEAVNKALENNNSIKKEQYIYEEIKEKINLSKANFKPQLNIGYIYNANDENLGQGKDNSNANITLSYNLFNGLWDKYNLESSKNLEQASTYTLNAAKYDLILNTKRTYINYLKNLKNIQTMKNGFELLKQQYKDSQNRFTQGLLAKSDLLQVNAQMLQAKQNLARARANSKIARLGLKNILGGKLEENEIIKDLNKKDILLENYSLDKLNNRSEIKALEKTIDSLKNQKSANKGDFLPKVNMDLTYTKFGDDALLKVENNRVDEQKTASIKLSWNLYNGSKTSLQNIIFQKKISQISEDLALLKLSVKTQYEKAMEEFKVSKLNYETAKISLEQSKENYKIVNNRFKEGLSSSTDLINANFLFTRAKQSLENAFYDRFLAKATLDRIFEK